MDETATRRKKIDPALYGVGWEQVPGSEILPEQRRIVARLDALSSRVMQLEENQRKVVAECAALKQAILREVFE